MDGIKIPYDKNVIVGIETSDDAGVYRITDDMALVQTLDFITPICDDPFIFGKIAACNSLSDVYAMGGRPVTAMNIVAYSTKTYGTETLTEILRGGLAVLEEAGVQLVGGHSVEDNEIKYGLSVTGIIDPNQVYRNRGLAAGDAIVLTKPPGSGIIATAIKAEMCGPEHLEDFYSTLTTLNRHAADIMKKYLPHACTDVTGFGLAGHIKEMLGDNNLMVDISASNIEFLSGAREYASMGFVPAGMYRNRDFVGGLCSIDPGVPRDAADIIFDPQTSGGLLIALEWHMAEALVDELRKSGLVKASIAARVSESGSPVIKISR